LIDVLRKLSGENGSIWAWRIGKALRGEAVPQIVKTEPVSSDSCTQVSKDKDQKPTVETYELKLVGFQRTRNLDKDETRLTIIRDGSSEQVEVVFLGAIPEPYFLLLLHQRAKMTTISGRDSTGGSFVHGEYEEVGFTDQRLEILSGDLAGQYFTGSHDYYC